MHTKEVFINLHDQKHVYTNPKSLKYLKVGMKFDFIWKKFLNF